MTSQTRSNVGFDILGFLKHYVHQKFDKYLLINNITGHIISIYICPLISTISDCNWRCAIRKNYEIFHIM